MDFAIVGTGAGGGDAGRQAGRAGFSVVVVRCRPVLAAAGGFRLGRGGAEQALLDRRPHHRRRGPHRARRATTRGRAVGGCTVHFAWSRCASGRNGSVAGTQLGYGVDWPIPWQEMWRYYDEVEEALKIAGPVRYPWGPPRRRYPYRAHEVNASGLVLARGAEELGIPWAPTPLATVSAPRGQSPPCVYRGFCTYRLLDQRQAERADHLGPARHRGRRGDPRPRHGRADRDWAATGASTGVHYHREGGGASSGRATSSWRAMRSRRRGCCSTPPARNSRMASPTARAWSGTHLMMHSGHGVFGRVRGGDPLVQGPALARPHRALELHRHRQGFRRRLCRMSQGPLPVAWARCARRARDLGRRAAATR